MKNNIRYLLAIDGGGTKTEFILSDKNLNVLNRVLSGSSNPVNIGICQAVSVLRQGIEEVCSGIDLYEVSAFAGLAGAGSAEIVIEIERLFKELEFGCYKVGTDADSAVEASLRGQDGIALLLGTGIICYYRKDGVLGRIGGRGYMIDKGGSGYCYGSDVLNAAFEYLDSRGNSKLIFDLVESRLCKKLEDAVSDIYSGGPAYVASFAPIVFDAYKRGDDTAEKIIRNNLEETAKIINTAISRFEQNKNIVICGGLAEQKEIIKEILPEFLSDEVSFDFLKETISYGAMLIAKQISEGE